MCCPLTMCCLFLLILAVGYYFVNWWVRSLKIEMYHDKHVFVTGCDSGFGRDLVRCLDRLGFPVFAGCLTDEGATSLSRDCSSRVLTVHVDVTIVESIESAAKFVKERLPDGRGLWAVVNNAGIVGMQVHSEMCTREDYHHVMQVNLYGLADVTRIFLPLVRKEQGRIINTSSAVGRVGMVFPPYTVSKTAVEGFSDVLRRELYYQNIKVSIVEPGGFRTNISQDGGILNLPNIKLAYDRAGQEVKTAYGADYVDRIYSRLKLLTSPWPTNTDPVTAAYVHAITSQYPHTRYAPGTKLMYKVLLNCPTGITDWLCANLLNKLDKANGFSTN